MGRGGPNPLLHRNRQQESFCFQLLPRVLFKPQQQIFHILALRLAKAFVSNSNTVLETDKRLISLKICEMKKVLLMQKPEG